MRTTAPFFTVLIWALVACNDIIEPDISDDLVTIVAPGDSVTSDSSRVTFFWEPLDDALDYQLQIVTGSFDSPQFLILDTLTARNVITLDLDSGTYQWGVRGGNNAYTTRYLVRTLFVLNNRNNEEELELIFPENNEVLADTIVQFRWDNLSGTEDYIFKILTDPEVTRVTANNSITESFERNTATYRWQVTAVRSANGTNVTSEVFEFTIDPN